MVYLWKYKNNAHHCGIQIHQHPFRMIQDPPQNPSSHLYFSNRTLEDPTNGPIHMRNLHLSVRFSNTITVFCLTFLANPPEVNQICDILLPYMQFTLHHVSRRHESTNFATCQLPQDNLQYIRECDPHSEEQNSLLTFRTPIHFSNLTNDFYNEPPVSAMETQCAVGLIYTLRLYYITYHCHTSNGLFCQ
jgi:hypothetical protein